MVEALHACGFPVLEGTLYPLLNRLRRDGLIEHEWQESASGPPRKYFALTAEGRTQLARFRDYWTSLTHALTNVGN
ncbi:PadR family transcriptional regulator [Sphingobium sp. ZW T5_29]|uniref:PadR family transcriptional regulator n=1 Tax=Sphingobium sp. ZW T5_29 TaxID=3378077 RepID=UPI0038555EBB